MNTKEVIAIIMLNRMTLAGALMVEAILVGDDFIFPTSVTVTME